MTKPKNVLIFFTSLSLIIFYTLFAFTSPTTKLRFYQKHFHNRDNLQDISRSYILTDEIKIGNPPQNLEILLEFFTTGLFILDSNRSNIKQEYISPDNNYFKSNESNTFEIYKERDFDKIHGIDFDYRKKKIESIRVNDDVYIGKDLVVKDCSFFFAKTITNAPFGAGFLGLDLNNRYFSTWEYKRILSQLYNFDNENFLISFNKNSNEEGFIYLNLTIDNDTSLSEKDITVYPKLSKENLLKNYVEYNLAEFKWKIKIDEVRFSNDFVKKGDSFIQFDLNPTIIEGSKAYFEYLKKAFFEKYNLFSDNICYVRKYNLYAYKYYKIHICDERIEKYLSYFPKLTFIFHNHKIEFEPNELFQKTENLQDNFTENSGENDKNAQKNRKKTQYVFLIYQNNVNYYGEGVEFWRLGSMFFKKVDLFFDASRFKIGLLFDDSQKINGFSILFENNKSIWVIGFIVLSYLIFYAFLEKKLFRKKNNKKNELLNNKNKDEEFNYENKKLEDFSFN